MRRAFVQRVIDELEPEGRILAVCAGDAEREVLPQATLTNIRTGQDAHRLPYESQSFDWAFVSDGLHHCSQPHRVLTEMYRVSRIGVIVVESRDSLVMRLAERAHLAERYELSAVARNGGSAGGVDNGSVPNHVYRWTEREFEKTLRSYDPTGPLRFQYFSAVSLPERLARLKPVERPISFVLRRQCNTFAMVALRPKTTWPWLVDRATPPAG